MNYKELWLNSERDVNALTHKLAYANGVIEQRNAELSSMNARAGYGAEELRQRLFSKDDLDSQEAATTIGLLHHISVIRRDALLQIIAGLDILKIDPRNTAWFALQTQMVMAAKEVI